jgi:hypothetical protein
VKKILGIVLLIINTVALQAQDNNEGRIPRKDKTSEKRERINALLKLEEEGEPAFKKQSVFGIKLNTDGYGISWEKGKYLTPKKTRLLQFELNEKKHPKEGKFATSQNPFTGQINSVIIGKQNNFYQFKAGIGEQYLLGGKANKSGVAVSFIYAGGLSIGLAKPYLVNVADTLDPNVTDRVTWDTILANPSNYPVIGASGVTYGWNQLKIKPGLHVKGAMRFDYGRFHEAVSAIEAGLNVEYYFQKIPQMVYSTPKNFFFNAYISILFGRRR